MRSLFECCRQKVGKRKEEIYGDTFPLRNAEHGDSCNVRVSPQNKERNLNFEKCYDHTFTPSKQRFQSTGLLRHIHFQK